MVKKMSVYLNIKIREDKVKNLKKVLKKKGLNPRSNAEAINILIHNFLLENPSNQNPVETATEETS